MASLFDRTALWGDLAAAYLGEVAAAGVYEQALRHLADPEAHERLAAWLEVERRRARGLRGHLAGVGPALPDGLVGLVRDVARAAGVAAALRGPDAAVALARDLGRLGATRFGPLAGRFPAGSVEAERFLGFEAEAGARDAWLQAWRRERGADGLVDQVEAVEHASIVDAPLDAVFEVLAGFGHWGALLGVPVQPPAEAAVLGEGLRYRIRVGFGPVGIEVASHVAAWDPPVFWVERREVPGFDRFEHHRRLEPLGSGRTLVADRLLVRPGMLPPPPESLRPSPWKLALELALWQHHDRLRGYLAHA